MSGFIVKPPTPNSSVFNLNFYQSSSFDTLALTGVVKGTATASKALVLDENKSITGITSLTSSSVAATGAISAASVSATGAITSATAVVSTSVSVPKIILGAVGTANETASVLQTAGTLFIQKDGASLRGIDAANGHILELGQYTNANGNGFRIGTTTDSPFYITTANTLRLQMTGGGNLIGFNGMRIGLGPTNTSAPLHINNSANYTFASTVYRLRTDSGVTESAGVAVTYAVSAIFNDYIACSAMAMTSDRRLKKNIQIAPLDRIQRLYDLDVCLYDWKDPKKQGQEVGLIAQDLVKAQLTDLTSIFYRDDMEEGEDPVLEPARAQLNVDYSRISVYNMKMIQSLLARIELLERYAPISKFLKKQ